jgi:glycosyltransferase involved in cell wall biosynthesis
MTNLVSIIIPCLNEEKHIGNVIAAIAGQTFPNHLMEVLIADGGSTDGTIFEIQEKQKVFPGLLIKIIDNPKKIIPAALNLAIQASAGEIIIRMDAHTIPDSHYVEYCVQDLKEGKGTNVGGLWLIQAGCDSWIAKSIACAASHPLGVGDAKYRYSQEASYVDTVPFGAVFRKLYDEIGFYDEGLLTNEDYEMNMRIKKQGGKVYFDPRIKSKYYARASIPELARQYWRYGYWKFQMLRKFPDTIRLRQAIPPLFVAGLAILLLLSIFVHWFIFVFVSVFALYLLSLLAGAISACRKEKDWRLLLGIPLAIMTMHFCWGAGFIAGIFKKEQRL